MRFFRRKRVEKKKEEPAQVTLPQKRGFRLFLRPKTTPEPTSSEKPTSPKPKRGWFKGRTKPKERIDILNPPKPTLRMSLWRAMSGFILLMLLLVGFVVGYQNRNSLYYDVYRPYVDPVLAYLQWDDGTFWQRQAVANHDQSIIAQQRTRVAAYETASIRLARTAAAQANLGATATVEYLKQADIYMAESTRQAKLNERAAEISHVEGTHQAKLNERAAQEAAVHQTATAFAIQRAISGTLEAQKLAEKASIRATVYVQSTRAAEQSAAARNPSQSDQNSSSASFLPKACLTPAIIVMGLIVSFGCVRTRQD